MPASTTLLQFLLMLAAGWLHRQQAAVIEYLKAENGLLRKRLGAGASSSPTPSAGSLPRRRGW
jgi:hypothetical protein